MDVQWWHWIVFGLFLALLEVISAGGFYLIFFGVAALLVGLIDYLGFGGPLSAQILLFSVVSVVSLVLFRDRLVRRVQLSPQAPPIDELVGEPAVALVELVPNGVGKVELRGTTWSARTTSGVIIAPGARCRVTRVDGLLLYVEPEGDR